MHNRFWTDSQPVSTRPIPLRLSLDSSFILGRFTVDSWTIPALLRFTATRRPARRWRLGLFNFRVLRVQAAAWPRLKGSSGSVFAEILSRKREKGEAVGNEEGVTVPSSWASRMPPTPFRELAPSLIIVLHRAQGKSAWLQGCLAISASCSSESYKSIHLPRCYTQATRVIPLPRTFSNFPYCLFLVWSSIFFLLLFS